MKFIKKKTIPQISNLRFKNYHWNDLKVKKKDYIYLGILYEKILKKLVKKLNIIHKVNYDVSYWRIIVGPWLYTFTTSSYDRWKQLPDLMKKNKKLNYYANNKNINLNFNDYIKKITGSNDYNLHIFHKIHNFNTQNITSIFKLEKSNTEFFREILNSVLYKLQIFYFNFFIKKKKNIFFTSYFNKKCIFYFIKNFGKYCNFLFYFNFKDSCKKKDYNFFIRKKLFLDYKPYNSFEKYLKSNIFHELPIIYLEKYKLTKESLNYKNNRKVNIITSTEHISDDTIKIWIAEKIIKGSKLYIYDHSNSLRLLMNDYNHELKISKKIISNFHYNNKKFLNLPELKFSLIHKKKNIKKCENGSIILYEGPKYPGKLNSCPAGPTNSLQFRQSIKFHSGLKKAIQKKIIFKTPPYSKIRFDTEFKIKKMFGKKKIYAPSESLSKILINSKFIICTYPQTTFLETLISEKPFIIVYPRKLWRFNKQNEDFLKKLINKKILFFDEKKASNHVNKIWDNIDLWWNSSSIKSVRNEIKNKNFNFKLCKNNQWKIFLKRL